MKTVPILQSIDQLPLCAVAIEQPLVLLLENGPAFSALLATHVSAEPDDGAIILEECIQVRIEQNGTCHRKQFDQVVVVREDAREHWIASPDGFESIFSQPSADPYVFVQLSQSGASKLLQAINAGDFDSVFEELCERFASLPRFYAPTPSELRAPDNYATGQNRFTEAKRFL
jgi:hypothetical protein